MTFVPHTIQGTIPWDLRHPPRLAAAGSSSFGESDRRSHRNGTGEGKIARVGQGNEHDRDPLPLGGAFRSPAHRAAKRMPRAWGGLARSSSATVNRRVTNASPQRSSACSILRTSTMSIPTPRTSVMRDRPPRPRCEQATTDRRFGTRSRRQLRFIDEHDGNPFADWIAAAALRAHDPIALQADRCFIQRTREDLQQFLVDQRMLHLRTLQKDWVLILKYSRGSSRLPQQIGAMS